MLILTCIIILKYWGGKYRGLSAFLVVMILLLLIFLIRKVYNFFDSKNNIQDKEWVNIQDFSNTLKMDKIGKMQSYPEITVLSEIDGEILSLNISTGDIVEEYQILMQINNNSNNSDYDNIDEIIGVMYDNYEELEKQYKKFKDEYRDEIKILEKQLFNNKNSLIQAMEFNDIESREILKNEIEKISEEYDFLKTHQEDMENRLNILDNEINMLRKESNKYFFELEKGTPQSPIKGIIGDIYVNEGENVQNGDRLVTIINNNFTPEISVNLDFNEYLLIKDLTGVDIIIENENWGDFEYEGEIYTRSPILNDEGKYTITIKVIDDNVSDLILNDENSTITINFNINSLYQWIPTKCFKKIGNIGGVITLRDGDIIVDKEIGIKNRWNNWINIDNLALFGLEKEEEKDGIDLCIEDWNNEWYKDESVVEWRNQFETVEDFCSEFIKENPMYWTGHRNLAIVSELGGSEEKIEVLCDIE